MMTSLRLPVGEMAKHQDQSCRAIVDYSGRFCVAQTSQARLQIASTASPLTRTEVQLEVAVSAGYFLNCLDGRPRQRHAAQVGGWLGPPSR